MGQHLLPANKRVKGLTHTAKTISQEMLNSIFPASERNIVSQERSFAVHKRMAFLRMRKKTILSSSSWFCKLFYYLPKNNNNKIVTTVFLKNRFSLRARRVHVRFVRVLGRGKRVFKESVRLIARFYSRSEYEKPFEY